MRRLRGVVILAAALALGLVWVSSALGHEGRGPLEVEALTRPAPALATDKRRHLIYDLMLVNEAAAPVTLDELTVRARGRRLASFEGDELAALMLVLGATGPTNSIGPGGVAFVFIELSLSRHDDVPSWLNHRLELSGAGEEARIRVPVRKRAPVAVGRPLRGAGILAVDAHDGAVFPVDDGFVFSQRFALDFVVFDGTSTFAGDPTLNESYFIYGDPIKAVRKGRIVAARDGVAENVPGETPPITTPEALLGNYVVQRIGKHRYALYAHFQTGSVRVEAGERVRRGDLLGRVGNTGNSDEPHLHFHVTSGPDPLGTDGVPYVFDRFRYEARLDPATFKVLPAEPPRIRRKQLPLHLDVIAFRRR